MTAPTTRQGEGWIIFSGIMLAIAGLLDFFNGLWAMNHADTTVDTLFFENDLDAWGLFYVIVGIVLFLAGLAVFARAQWARWVGVFAASVALVTNMFWIFAYPETSLVLVIISAMVIYGLVVYGEREYS
jgi:hypothetical protein